MTDTLTFIQNQDYEGFQAHFTKLGVDLNISALTAATFRVFTQDLGTLKFSGTWGSEVTFLTDGTDGKIIFTPDSGDMSDSGLLRGEVEITLGGKKLKKQGLIVKIEPESPTS
jgi:hypothetical protein